MLHVDDIVDAQISAEIIEACPDLARFHAERSRAEARIVKESVLLALAEDHFCIEHTLALDGYRVGRDIHGRACALESRELAFTIIYLVAVLGAAVNAVGYKLDRLGVGLHKALNAGYLNDCIHNFALTRSMQTARRN